MSGNPKGSRWYATEQAARRRHAYQLTLSDGARMRWVGLAERSGLALGRVVEALLLAPGAERVIDQAAARAAGKEGEK